MNELDSTSPAELRATIARKRIPLFKLAAAVGLHPTTLGQILNERKPLKEGIAERLLEALDSE